MFEVIITKEELYDKCENVEQLYDKFYYPLLVEYKELKKQVEEYQKDIKDLDNQNKRAFENMQLNQLKVCNMIKQQKEFINYLEDEIHTIETTFSQINGNYGLMNEKLEALKEVLQKYEEIMNGDDNNDKSDF